MKSSSSRILSRPHPYISPTNRDKFVWKQISQAIIGKSCPICFKHIEDRSAAVITVCMHVYCIDCIRKWSNLKRKCPLCNAEFNSWFCKINFSTRTFHTEQLPALTEARKVITGDSIGSRRNFLTAQRVIRSSREELSIVNRRSRPLPRRRSFGESRLVPSDVIKQRVLRWRASIYEQHLQAVPCSERSSLEQDVTGRNSYRGRLLQRIEPWIRRELHAVLGDPDPAILVHSVTSLFISRFEEKQKVRPGQCGIVEENYLQPLQPFLFEKTNMFWHELRCFAESSLNMETYDTVVEYVKWSN